MWGGEETLAPLSFPTLDLGLRINCQGQEKSMNDIRGRTEDEEMIIRLAVQREGLKREGNKRARQVLEAAHALL